ncbi:hypothetical protein [Nostoc sp.]
MILRVMPSVRGLGEHQLLMGSHCGLGVSPSEEVAWKPPVPALAHQ